MRLPFRFGSLALLLVVSSFLRAEEGQPKPQRFRGILTTIEDSVLTLVAKGDSGSTELTFRIDGSTKLQRESDQDETYQGEGGRERTRPKLEKITDKDLRVGSQVQATYREKGIATEILVLRPKKHVGSEDRGAKNETAAPRKTEGEKPKKEGKAEGDQP